MYYLLARANFSKLLTVDNQLILEEDIVLFRSFLATVFGGVETEVPYYRSIIQSVMKKSNAVSITLLKPSRQPPPRHRSLGLGPYGVDWLCLT